jgi:2-aminoethylphosphonate-pyruvate transaminase
LPRNLSYANLHDQLKQEGFVVYAGQSNLASSLFRISTMGELTASDMERLLSGFARLMQ